MKPVLLCSVAVLLMLVLAGCHPGGEPAIEAAAEEALARPAPTAGAGLQSPAPVSTAEPRATRYYRSYPAPTGFPAFRRYYQMRCYPGCHYGATPAVPTESVVLSQATSERPYRSYPAPTGQPGFRRYYQIRCYPGCHSYAGSTPVPTRIHP